MLGRRVIGAGLLACAAVLPCSKGYAQQLLEEPLEYVRACSLFGRGYFYIPGTETCLSIQGQIRAEIGAGGDVGSGADPNGYFTVLRPTLRFSTASDSELGTLRTLTEHRFSYSNGNFQGYRLYRNYIQVDGFKAGLDETAFKTIDDDYGEFINDGVIPAGGYRTFLISYTAKLDPRLAFTVSVEEGGNDDANVNVKARDMPYIVGGVRYEQGGFSTSLRAAYDSLNQAFAGKTRFSYDVNDRFNLWAMVGYKTNEDHYALDSSGRSTRLVDSFYGTWGGSTAGWTGLAYKLTNKTKMNVQLGYDGTRTFAATANIVYTLAPQLIVMPEVSYTSWNDRKSWKNDLDQVQFRVRLQHRF
ncbi:porin [Allorhizobium terrae]|uniref:Porin n=1 Tax=Allorhizobium terrae TaxID=1848972 RepID=A0A4V3W8D3_9HYPH|nr:porin [Allorhizobium terrae]THF50797.1 porin [Allorhizobium terrae]